MMPRPLLYLEIIGTNSLHDLEPKEFGNRKSLIKIVISICVYSLHRLPATVSLKKTLLLTPLLGAIVRPPERRKCGPNLEGSVPRVYKSCLKASLIVPLIIGL